LYLSTCIDLREPTFFEINVGCLGKKKGNIATKYRFEPVIAVVGTPSQTHGIDNRHVVGTRSFSNVFKGGPKSG
jgi:hypothetical protein